MYTFLYSAFIVELFLNVIQTCIQYAIVYNMMSLQGDFFVLFLASILAGIGTSAIGLVVCSIFDDKGAVGEAFSFVLLPQLLFIGLFVSVPSIFPWLRWGQYLCLLKYSINLQILAEFDPSLPSCTSSSQAAANCADIIDKLDASVDYEWVNWCILFVFLILARLIAGSILKYKSKYAIV